MIDTIQINNRFEKIESLREPCKYLGERTKSRAKENCQAEAKYLPIYACSLWVRCSPFGHTADPTIYRSCGDCTDYTP